MRKLPRGTVTFLFTDIAGSTHLLHDLGPEAYASALADHRQLLRAAFARHEGVEVDTQGDAFFVAFSSVAGAFAAAREATLALSGPVRVRMGLHTGTPHVTDEGYVGEDVHLGARIAAAGHGGQVLVSRTTQELMDGSAELLDLGEHRLKDFAEPVWIFQLGREPFPPLKTISNTNLPRPASSFVGRERETAEVAALLRDGSRLLTLSGPGGSGKTRLAIEAAAELVSEFKNGVFWVGLAALRDPALVSETIGQTLGAKAGLADHVGERELLLLLDNLEQVIDAAPDLAGLLEACPNLRLLVTSRELLRVRGEVEYAVPPLAEREAVELFCRRSQLQADETIGELCRRLDNLPLAVELAAARTSVLSPGQILERLSQRLDLLKGGRDAEARQQTLRATIEWSHDLLSREERALFRRLSVFVGGCTVEAAEQVADADLDTLQSLVDKSLIRHTGERFWMLETIREYAAHKVERAGEFDTLQRSHAEYVLQLASALEADAGSDGNLRTRFASEQDNFRAVLAWAESAGDTDLQLELIGRTWPFWWYRGHSGEGLRWVESALERTRGERSARQVKVLAAGAMFAHRHGDMSRLGRYAEESLEAATALGDKRLVIWPLIFRALYAEHARGDDNEATSLYERAIAAARASGDPRLVAIATNNLGNIALRQRDYAYAARLFGEAFALGHVDDGPVYCMNLAQTLYRAERSGEAAAAAREGLALAHEAGNLMAIEIGFLVLAAIACENQDFGRGARLLGAHEALWGVGREPLYEEADLAEATTSTAVNALGEEEYAAALAGGKAMSLDDAVRYALSP